MFTWIHNCPQRATSVEATIESVGESDIDQWTLWCHSEDLKSAEEIERWWEERLLEASDKSDFVLRLEDDVVVNKHIEHNIKNWPALQRDDFGVGSVFDLADTVWYRFKEPDGTVWNGEDWITAQGLVFKSSLVPKLVSRMREIRKDAFKFRRVLRLNFDQVVAAAIHDMGLRVFFHEPCLVDCIPGNGQSTVGENHDDYRAKNFDPHWRTEK
jgi:hypothetical protein